MTPRVAIEAGRPLSGQLLYRASEYSFMYQVADGLEVQRRTGSEGVTSLVADTLQLEVGVQTGQVLFAWGYLPSNSWRETDFLPPEVEHGVLRLKDFGELESGVSISISRGSEWKVEFNRTTGWVRVAVSPIGGEVAVQIADGVVVGVQGDRIVSVWLCPKFVD